MSKVVVVKRGTKLPENMIAASLTVRVMETMTLKPGDMLPGHMLDPIVGVEVHDDELKPCPFCGGEAYEHRSVNGSGIYKIGCRLCEICYKTSWYSDKSAPQVDIRTNWNRRVADVPQPKKESQ